MASPLQEYRRKNAERWTVLQDLPAWEIQSVMGWLYRIFVAYHEYQSDTFNHSIVRSIETENRLLLWDDLGIATDDWDSMRRSLYGLVGDNAFDDFMLFLECVVKYIRDGDSSVGYYRTVLRKETALFYLEASLERGSKWQVVFDEQADAGLIERVSPELTKAAKELDINYLTKAWNEAFALTPNPDKAIENAQKAIEAVASNKGLTAAKTSVYGNLLGDVRSHPDKYISAAHDAYVLAASISSDPANPVDYNEQFSNWFWTGLDLIQKSHPARHASTDTTDFVLSPEAGKQATLVATVYCQLIDAGYFTKKPRE